MREDSIMQNLTHDSVDAPSPSQVLLFMAFISGYALREQKAQVQGQILLTVVFTMPIVLSNVFVVLHARTLSHAFYLAVCIEVLALAVSAYVTWAKYAAYLVMKANADEMLSAGKAGGLKAAGIE